MELTIYQVDAFTDTLFRGNPAAVCPLEEWLDKSVMQKIALENNLSETAFFVKNDDYYDLKWFTPTTEVDLCGHATLAAAHVLFEHLNYPRNTIAFSSNSGPLFVSKFNDLISLNFPQGELFPCTETIDLEPILGVQPKELIWGGLDLIAVFDSEEIIKNLSPNFEKMKAVTKRGLIATAKGNSIDFVSRFFAPNYGINEDPVTGSAHTVLTPYWAKRLHKKALRARQLSQRGGVLFCQMMKKDNRVRISGKAVTYMIGTVFLNDKFLQ